MVEYSLDKLQDFITDIPDFDYSKIGKNIKSKSLKPKESKHDIAALKTDKHFSKSELKLKKPISPHLKLIMDVKLNVSVEIGKTNITLDDILKLEDGSIIRLNNNASEPIDIIVDDIPIAKGEVIIIDESFGIRLVEKLSNKEQKLIIFNKNVQK